MIGRAFCLLLMAPAAVAASWTPEFGKPLETQSFSILRGCKVADVDGATRGTTIVLAEQDAELAVRFRALRGLHRWTVRCRAETAGTNSAWYRLDGKRIHCFLSPKKQWGEKSFEFLMTEPGEHELSFTLREGPGFKID